MRIQGYRRRTTVATLTVLTSSGSTAPFASGDIFRVKVGRTGDLALLEVSSAAATLNGSSATAANPSTVEFNQRDLTLKEGVYDLEAAILTEAENVTRYITTGVFVVLGAMFGEEDESTQSETTTSSTSTVETKTTSSTWVEKSTSTQSPSSVSSLSTVVQKSSSSTVSSSSTSTQSSSSTSTASSSSTSTTSSSTT